MADNPQKPEDEKKKTEPIKVDSGEKKSDTTRIDLSSAKPPPSITDKNKLPADADDYFKRSTMRIDSPGSAGGDKDETTKIDASSAKDETTKIDAKSAKDKTSKINMSDAAKSEDDVFKSKTIPVGVPTPPPQNKGPAKPKTIQFKRPVAKSSANESIIVSPETTADATEMARKSETARIDLSSEEANRPATRPKTIRIKRPDGTSGKKSLTITRPEESEQATAPRVAPVVDGIESDEDEPGTLVTVAAVAALVIVGVLLYVLLAQTVAPNLSFPGRI